MRPAPISSATTCARIGASPSTPAFPRWSSPAPPRRAASTPTRPPSAARRSPTPRSPSSTEITASGTADASGAYAVSADLPEGASRVVITTTDRAGNATTKNLRVFVDAVPPVLKTTQLDKTEARRPQAARQGHGPARRPQGQVGARRRGARRQARPPRPRSPSRASPRAATPSSSRPPTRAATSSPASRSSSSTAPSASAPPPGRGTRQGRQELQVRLAQFERTTSGNRPAVSASRPRPPSASRRSSA